MIDDRANLIDSARLALLCCDGSPGYVAAVAVAADGTEHLLLAERESLGDESVVYDATCDGVVHEQLGALPSHWRARVQLAPFYCGALTKRGTRCRIPVAQAGASCAKHRATQRTP